MIRIVKAVVVEVRLAVIEVPLVAAVSAGLSRAGAKAEKRRKAKHFKHGFH
jgi:hypothetical protein